MKKSTTRKLEETSWLAQIIRDKQDVEFDTKGPTPRYFALNTLRVIINEADDKENDKIYYANYNGKRQIIICEIPSLMKHGYDFDTYGMQNKLRGLAERYKDDNGNYIVSVLTTNDLNSATVNDLEELLYQMAK